MATDLHSSHHSAPVVIEPKDTRSGLVLNTYQNGVRLIGLAQPTTWSESGIALASLALATARQAMIRGSHYADFSLRDRLERAMQAANDVVRAEHKGKIGHDYEARIGVGMTLALRSGKSATIAICPPSQVALIQRGTVTWLPRLESWNGDDPGLGGKPLGWCASPSPSLMTTTIEHGDEVLMTTAVVAEMLARSKRALSSTDIICQQITMMAGASAIDPIDIVALSTRFEPATFAGSMRSTMSQIMGDVDKRARAVWGALRSTDGLAHRQAPGAD